MLQMKEIDCPLCADTKRQPWGRENGFTAHRCTGCGLVYVSPRPSGDAITEATKLGQHATEAGQLSVTYRPNWHNKRMYDADIRSAFAGEIAAGAPIRWLDVGAGYGEFMVALKGLLPPGSVIQGLEPMEPKAAYAREQGLDMLTGELADIEARYDVISLMNVFSHIPDFREFLGDVVRLLAPGGSIFVRTGNGGDLSGSADYPDKLDLPDHLVFAGRKQLARFFREQELEPVWSAESRLDTPRWALASVVKRALGRKVPVVMPYRSAFRDRRVRFGQRQGVQP